LASPPFLLRHVMPRHVPLKELELWDLNVYTNTAINAVPGLKTSAG
jgi:hypothetical protein